jgi:capsular polysaccharide export protein
MNDVFPSPSSDPLREVASGASYVSPHLKTDALAGPKRTLRLDHGTGRRLAYCARALGVAASAAWPGPFPPRHERGAPLLAWFTVPVEYASESAFTDLLNRMLAAADALQDPVPRENITRLADRVYQLRALDATHRVSDESTNEKAPQRRLRILLIDERVSMPGTIWARQRRKAAFKNMIEASCARHPGATFRLVRSAGPGSGPWLSSAALDRLPQEITRLGGSYSLCRAIEEADHVYTVSAIEGVHALLGETPLHVFGAPYYAGWGLTNDSLHFAERTARPTLLQFFSVIFLKLARYLDPLTHGVGTLESLLDNIELQRDVSRRYRTHSRVAALHFQRWKRPFALPFLSAAACTLRWTHTPESLDINECAVLWGARSPSPLRPDADILRMEDGFIHSGGLGSDMSPPCSQVLDSCGIYFDATRPNDLTNLLNGSQFGDEELARAAALRQQIISLGLTKYNLGRQRPTWRAPAGKCVILVPGQVADDASIRLGTRTITTFDTLLREIRKSRPDAWVVYKPHPDVLSGNRRGLVDIENYADIVDTSSDIISLIENADEVHTLSSLSGFEALLRGKKVVTYGLPFYAGWGLTQDMLASIPWRKRRLTLDMLTAGVLLRYPLYWDWRLQRFTTPEHVVRTLAPLAARPLKQTRESKLRNTRKAIRWTRNLLRHFHWQLRCVRSEREEQAWLGRLPSEG